MLQVRLVDDDLNLIIEFELEKFTAKPTDILVLEDSNQYFEVKSVFSSIGKDGKAGIMLKVNKLTKEEMLKTVGKVQFITIAKIFKEVQKQPIFWIGLSFITFVLILLGIQIGKQSFN